MIRVLLSLLFVLTAQSVAAQCKEFKRLPDEQVRGLISSVKAEGADPFDQILAVETLACAKRKPVRDLAFRAMLRSPNDIIRTEAVFRALADRKSISLRLTKTEGLPEDALSFVNSSPILVFDVKHVDVDARCVSLYDRGCNPVNSVIVTRNEITLRYSNKHFAVLKHTADGRIVGEYAPGKWSIPAEIEVY